MGRYRLITRSDFDGLVCAMILKELDMLEDIMFVHPKDMQDGMIDVNEKDISTNVPYLRVFIWHLIIISRRREPRPLTT